MDSIFIILHVRDPQGTVWGGASYFPFPYYFIFPIPESIYCSPFSACFSPSYLPANLPLSALNFSFPCFLCFAVSPQEKCGMCDHLASLTCMEQATRPGAVAQWRTHKDFWRAPHFIATWFLLFLLLAAPDLHLSLLLSRPIATVGMARLHTSVSCLHPFGATVWKNWQWHRYTHEEARAAVSVTHTQAGEPVAAWASL